MLLDEDGNTLRVVAATGRDLSPDEMDPVEVGQGVAGVALEGREPLVVADIDGDGRFAKCAADRYRSRSLAVAPLRDGGRPLGVLCATDRDGGRSFDAEDLSLLRILAFQIGPLIAGFRNGRGQSKTEAANCGDAPVSLGLSGESEPGDSSTVQDPPGPDMLLRKRASVGSSGGADDAELVRAICETLATEVEPERLIRESLRAVADRVPAAPVSLYLIDPKDGQLILDGQYEAGGAGDRERLSAGRGLTGSVVGTGRLIATDTPERDHRFDPEVDTPESGVIGPMLCLPVRLRAKTLGVMRVFPTDGAHASARTAELLTSAISAAVRNVLMYRSLLEAVDEVARVRCEVQSQGKLS
jgi:GAF domain-containing protein